VRITNDRPDTVNVGWELTTTCNYHCWYCEDYFHNGKHRWPDLDTALDFFHELCSRRKHVSVDIQGGEPTLWPGLSEFIHRKPDNLSVEITTNGSRTVEWWVKNYKKFDQITFSFHPDTASYDHYIDVLNAIADGSNHIHLFLIAVHEHMQKLMNLYDYLKESDLKLDCNFKILVERVENKKIRDNNAQYDLKHFQDHKFYRNTVTETMKPTSAFLDGKKIDFHEFKVNKKEDFSGWTCKAGITRLWIKANGDIYRASCSNDAKIGNIFFDTDIFDLEPTVCKTKVCPCRDDIVVEKWKTD
jgi:MoaA/NifB/PqqE/SkfB family radical SAM enzyme